MIFTGSLIAALTVGPVVQQNVQVPYAAALRAEKLVKLDLVLHKSQKVKDFKYTQENDMKEWLKCFDHEILQLKKICCINEDLTRDEYVESFLQEIHC